MRKVKAHITSVKKKKFTLYILLSIILLVLLTLYFNYIVNPIILNTSESKVRSLTLKAINSAVSEVVSDSALYNELVTITTNDEGDVSLITANSILINRLSKELAKIAQGKIENIGQQGVMVPLGTFSGMPILVGRGPDVKIRLLPIGSIACNFESEFTSAGINQTHHRIYVNIESKVTMILPVENRTITNIVQVLICESIIIGKIPSTYLNSSQLQDMLDLIPD